MRRQNRNSREEGHCSTGLNSSVSHLPLPLGAGLPPTLPLREYEQKMQPSPPVLVLILSAEAPVFRRKSPSLLPVPSAQEVIPHPTNINGHLMSVVPVVKPWDPCPALDNSSWGDQGSRPPLPGSAVCSLPFPLSHPHLPPAKAYPGDCGLLSFCHLLF